MQQTPVKNVMGDINASIFSSSADFQDENEQSQFSMNSARDPNQVANISSQDQHDLDKIEIIDQDKDYSEQIR